MTHPELIHCQGCNQEFTRVNFYKHACKPQILIPMVESEIRRICREEIAKDKDGR